MKDLTFEIYSSYRDHSYTYSINKTGDGWHISYKAINGDCDKEGKPYFYDNFNHDYIEYPVGFGDYLASLWRQIDDKDIDREEAQEKLQQLADWITTCDKSQPVWKDNS